MAIGNKLVAVSRKGMSDSDEAAYVDSHSVREAGIRSLIRQRIRQDSQVAPARPRAYHTDSHSAQLENERAANEDLGTEEEWIGGASQTPSLQCSPHPDPLTPSNPCSKQQGSASSAPADRTNGCGEERAASVSSGYSTSEVQEADCTGCQSEGMPELRQRPQLLGCHQKLSDDQGTTSTGHADGFAVLASSRIKAAAPHYALAVQSGQQQPAGSGPHAQQAMPFSHLLCLWAIKLVLPHPVTQKVLKLSIPDPPVFDQVRGAEARLASQINSTEH